MSTRRDGSQVINADSGVALGGFQPCVSEHLGRVTNIGTTFEHECGNCVAEEVTTASLLDAGKGDVATDRP